MKQLARVEDGVEMKGTMRKSVPDVDNIVPVILVSPVSKLIG